MYIRKTAAGDIPAVLNIYEQGRRYMRLNGNMHQWADGYPSEETVTKDIHDGISYLACDDETSEILAVFVFAPGPDKTYLKIYEGNWKTDDDYHVIHRIATCVHRKGVASFIYSWAMQRCNEIRIDTHRDNIPMQNSLKKNGFEYCGIIYLESGDERLAFSRRAD